MICSLPHEQKGNKRALARSERLAQGSVRTSFSKLDSTIENTLSQL